MADAFSAALKEFEKVVAEIGELRQRLEALEAERDLLRKQVRSLAGNTDSTAGGGAATPGAGVTSSILAIVNAVRGLGGSGQLAEIASAAKLDTKVAATRLQRAIRAGALVRSGHGQYQLPPSELQNLMSGSTVTSRAPDSNER